MSKPQNPKKLSNTSGFSMSAMTKTLVIIFALNLIVERIAQLSQAIGVSGETSWQSMLQLSLKLPQFWTGILVPVTYLFALWSAAGLLRAFEESKAIDEAVIKALHKLGANLMYAGIAALVIAPTLESWINLGGRSIRVSFDISPVAVGMIGMILKLIGRRLLENLSTSDASDATNADKQKTV